MNPINIPYGETWTVLRGARDRVGDMQIDDHHTIESCVFWWESVTENDDRRDTSTVYGYLAVPRSADLLASDHARSPDNALFSVVGKPQWDRNHPMTGWNPGYKVARLKGVF